MKTIIVTILLFVNVISHVSGATDYCSLCKWHIACNNTGAFATKCPSDAVVMDLSQADIDSFLKIHNSLRNTLAGGLTPGFSSAANISAVAWDPELAYFAQLNVRKCEMVHDSCRKTVNCPYAGQNLWIASSTSSIFPRVSSVAVSAATAWYNEYKSSNQTQMSSCCSYASGHFTQLAQYRVVAIGCAIARYTDNGWRTNLVACNYSYGNLVRQPIYIPGPPASGCKNGNDLVYPNLCKI